MKCKLDVFTIFIILLIVLLVFIMINKWFTLKETKETFIDFNKSKAENSSVTVYIPQYTTDTTRTLIHLYDSLYFDNKNGYVIEVASSQTGTETTADSISQIIVIPRDGSSFTTSQGQTVNDKARPYDTPESKITTTTKTYDQYTYTTGTLITSGNYYYKYFYYTWYNQTFIHLFKYSVVDVPAVGTTAAVPPYKLIYIKSYLLNSDEGLKYIITATPDPSSILSPTKNLSDFIYNDANNKNNTFLPNYLGGNVKVFQVTPLVFYDIANGNIILKDSGTGMTVYDRAGGVKTTPTNTGQPTQLTGQPTIFTISSDKSGMVLVTSYYNYTIISVIIVDNANNGHAYKIAATQRFNRTQPVNDLASDTDNAAPTTAPATTGPATTPPGGWDKWNEKYNKNWKEHYDKSKGDASGCGNDPTCWYWYFKTLPSFNSNSDTSAFFSDDYFLKTEAVPPVCPQCPNCPGSGNGTCTTCGGNGGSGTNVNSCSPVDLHLTPIVSTKYTDNLGNIYIATTDNSGNTRYILQGKMTGTGTGGAAAGGAGINNMTAVDKDGQFISTVDPNTLGGGLTLSTLSLDQTGTSLFNNTAGVANNVINTAGGAVGLAGNLLKDAGSGAVNLLKDTGSGAVNLLKDTGSGIANLGSGGLQTQQGAQYNSVGGTNVGRVGGSPMASTSDKTFGKMPGQTPVDNYSYYGALQSKGGNFMPVTADFSSFRK